MLAFNSFEEKTHTHYTSPIKILYCQHTRLWLFFILFRFFSTIYIEHINWSRDSLRLFILKCNRSPRFSSPAPSVDGLLGFCDASNRIECIPSCHKYSLLNHVRNFHAKCVYFSHWIHTIRNSFKRQQCLLVDASMQAASQSSRIWVISLSWP